MLDNITSKIATAKAQSEFTRAVAQNENALTIDLSTKANIALAQTTRITQADPDNPHLLRLVGQQENETVGLMRVRPNGGFDIHVGATVIESTNETYIALGETTIPGSKVPAHDHTISFDPSAGFTQAITGPNGKPVRMPLGLTQPALYEFWYTLHESLDRMIPNELYGQHRVDVQQAFAAIDGVLNQTPRYNLTELKIDANDLTVRIGRERLTEVTAQFREMQSRRFYVSFPSNSGSASYFILEDGRVYGDAGDYPHTGLTKYRDLTPSERQHFRYVAATFNGALANTEHTAEPKPNDLVDVLGRVVYSYDRQGNQVGITEGIISTRRAERARKNTLAYPQTAPYIPNRDRTM